MNKVCFIIVFLCSLIYAGDTLSFMPKYFDIDSVVRISLPKEPGEILDSTLPYFKQFPLDSGMKCPKNGILISDRTAAEFVFYKLGYQRQATELKLSKYLLKTHYDASISAEKAYQKTIMNLEKENKRSWVEKNSVYIGALLGIATCILTEWAVLHVN